MYIVIVGDMTIGFDFYGPFSHELGAKEFADSCVGPPQIVRLRLVRLRPVTNDTLTSSL